MSMKPEPLNATPSMSMSAVPLEGSVLVRAAAAERALSYALTTGRSRSVVPALLPALPPAPVPALPPALPALVPALLLVPAAPAAVVAVGA